MKRLAKRQRTALLLASALLTQACAATGRHHPVPENLVDSAHLAGAPLARMWGDEVPVDLEARVALLASQTKQNADPEQERRTFSVLAISGGGPDGAFGAGLLKG